MNWLQTIVYALLSGITEFLPVSSSAHQSILLTLFGQSDTPTALNFTIHLGALVAVYINCQSHLAALARTQRLLSIPKSRRKRQPNSELIADLRIFRTASIIAVLVVLVASIAFGPVRKLNWLALLLCVNGIILYITCRIATGSKGSVSMNRFDSILLGFASGIGVFSGLSRTGFGVSTMIVRGASPKNALNWCFLISIPFLCALCIADLVSMFTLGVFGFGFVALLKCVFAAAVSFFGASLAISLLRFMAIKIGFSLFSYYSWGLGLFAFLLYMI